ncbi:hypothetical protein QBC46DRAFT_78067 [Diplogelasinospora grovesii]|uniref:ubiquitinyl hydrolase 1 n=1 Tax=Diplogelasinospora grovesii TaxID=303347 RepID=A0AAN6S6W9_9PEZI|nr:hypothetical protein QBC46DRAFT_78067 [Diplogelasinospora grovesii]
MMNNRGHLPAGQPMPGGVEMGPGPGGGGGPVSDRPMHGGHGGGGRETIPRRGGRQQHFNPGAHHYHPHQHHQHQHLPQQPMYPGNYMAAPYGGAPYYMPAPHYPNGAMGASAAYMPYPPAAAYNRSPPAMQHYVPMVPQPYSRPPQHSPVVPAPYQTPPPAAPMMVPPPHTPSSTHSHVPAAAAPPPPMTPPVQQTQAPDLVPAEPQPQPQTQPQPEPETEPRAEQQTPEPAQQTPQTPARSSLTDLPPREPYKPPLPWLSVPDAPFPSRAARSRRRRRILQADAKGVELPQSQQPADSALEQTQQDTAAETKSDAEPASRIEEQAVAMTPKAAADASTLEPVQPRAETPSTQDQPSEYAASTSPTSPSSVQPQQASTPATNVTPTQPAKPAARTAVPAVPAVPVIPVLPKATPKEAKPAGGADNAQNGSRPATAASTTTVDGAAKPDETPSKEVNGTAEGTPSETCQPAATSAPAPAPAWSKPKLWTGLFNKAASAAANAAAAAVQAHANGTVAADGTIGGAGAVGAFAKSNVSSIAEALQAYRVGAAEKIAFLEPRGLVNTGNMCYMNSILQVLIACVPFYDFLDQVSKKAAYSFKSETPLLDAMIMFMREFKVIDSAVSVEQLRRRLKAEELEQYGEPFTPEFIYDAIKKLPRFANMRRGHQQDAEEFLGFLLEGLHDECAQAMRVAPASTNSTAPTSPSASSKINDIPDGGDDWLEVGPRQKPAVTRSSGFPNTSSPITKIFGGQLRSELRVPGLKSSVTLEPYQPLQLDIGSPEVRNIVDALKGLTRPETLHGDFNSPRGKDVRATKQVFIESLPPVLILHLKRFQFDAEGHGTVKIWKKIGYPLELEIPHEVFSRQKRNTALADGSLPKYRLITVVYHHGKNASGGHYTVDVRRQDGREWIRMDDTVIRRLRSEDVAEGGAEEEAIKTGHAVDSRKENSAPASNRFDGINDEDAGDDDGWKQATPGSKKWSSVVNGATPNANGPKPSAAKQHKENMKDNKVAYLLFYQRI